MDFGSDKYLSSGIDPVSPYRRIAQQQSRLPKRRHGDSSQASADTERPTRRFLAMRQMIDRLKERYAIERVEIETAQQQLKELTVEVIHRHLLAALDGTDLTYKARRHIRRHVREQQSALELDHDLLPDLLTGSPLSPLFPGLEVLTVSLVHQPLEAFDLSCALVAEQCRQHEFTAQRDNLQLTLSGLRVPGSSPIHQLWLTLTCALGVIELDPEGRRAFLYQSSDSGFALYADRQISLEI